MGLLLSRCKLMSPAKLPLFQTLTVNPTNGTTTKTWLQEFIGAMTHTTRFSLHPRDGGHQGAVEGKGG